MDTTISKNEMEQQLSAIEIIEMLYAKDEKVPEKFEQVTLLSLIAALGIDKANEILKGLED